MKLAIGPIASAKEATHDPSMEAVRCTFIVCFDCECLLRSNPQFTLATLPERMIPPS